MSELKSNLTSVVRHLAEYRKQQRYRKKDEEAIAQQELMLQKYRENLASEISNNIMDLAKTNGSVEAFELKLAPYISDENENLRTQVAKTLMAHPELKRYKPQTVEVQVLNILTRIFQIPIQKDFQELNSTEIDPLLTQLTRIMLMEPLILEANDEAEEIQEDLIDENADSEEVIDDEDLYFDSTNEYLVKEREIYEDDDDPNELEFDSGASGAYIDYEKTVDSFEDDEFLNEATNDLDDDSAQELSDDFIDPGLIANIESKAIANLGNIGLTLIQNSLKICIEETDERKNYLRRDEIKNSLNEIKNYQLRTLKPEAIDKKLLLDIFNHEIEIHAKRNSRAEDLNREESILELTVDILSRLDLDLDSNFIKNFKIYLTRLDENAKNTALKLFRNTKIKEVTNDVTQLADQISILLTGNHKEAQNKKEKEEIKNSKLFATQFFIKNPNLVSPQLLGRLNDSENYTFAFAIIDAASKNDSMKSIIKNDLLYGIKRILKSLETEKNLNLGLYNHLLLLKPLITDPQELIDIYKDSSNEDTSMKYLAALLTSFPNTLELVNQLEENDFKLILEGFLDEITEIHQDANTDLKTIWNEEDTVRANILAGLNNNKYLEPTKIPDEVLQEFLRNKTGLQEFGEKLLDPNIALKTQINLINILGNRVIDHEEFLRKYVSIPQENGDLLSICTKFSNTHLDQNKEIELTVNKLFEFYKSFLKAKADPTQSRLRISVKNELKQSLLEMGQKAEPHLYRIIQEAKQNPTRIKNKQAILAESVLRTRNYLPELAA